MKNIKWVQLWSEDVLSDIDFQIMTAQQRGVFWTIVLLLYCNNGKIQNDPASLKELCNCEDFENIWPKVAKKFSTRNGVIKHKRVSKEIRKIKKLLQGKRRAGLKGARKRWHSQGAASGSAEANEAERNGTEQNRAEKLRIRNEQTLDVSHSVGQRTSPAARETSDSQLQSSVFSASSRPPFLSSTEAKGEGLLVSGVLRFNQALRMIITPRNQSDLTSFRNISNWLADGIRAGRFNSDIFKRVLDYAAESVKGQVRNPAAVFTSILKKELGYRSG